MATDMWTYTATLRDALGRYDLSGFRVVARDGDIGKIDKASYDQAGADYLVVDTGTFFGKKVLLPAGVISQIDVDGKQILANVTKDEVKNAPEYDPERKLDEDLRARLAGQYGAERRESEPPASVEASYTGGHEDIRSVEPVKNTIHNLVQTLSVKLDSAARYGLYRDDARKDGYEDCVEMFGRLEARERDSIAELLRCLRKHLGAAERETVGRASAR